jgi:D-serine deaminase-like pyridoxal phosphate-dependent protein
VQGETARAQWARYKKAIGDTPLPAALVDLDAFDANADRLFQTTRASGKTLRIASKSIRVPQLIRRLVDRGGGVVRGLMTYHARETAFLAEQGFDDLLLAYPTVQPCDAKALAAVARSGKTVSTVVDDVEQLAVLEEAAGAADVRLGVVVELDVSYRPVDMLHLGSRRSPLRTPDAVTALVNAIALRPRLEFVGLMAYEGHIAGLTDQNPFTRAMNPGKRLMKVLARRPMEQTRAAVVKALTAAGHPPRLFNGGGSGSLRWSGDDPALTEVTAGSGFMDSHLFDYFKDLDVEPATFFALQVVRRPSPRFVTCHGGGFVASGEAGPDRLPVPALPDGLEILPLEGAGEVQTPLGLAEGARDGAALALGDPVFFRHAKAGELAEHFNEYLLVRGDEVVARAPTYRGMGQCFLG